MPINFNFLIAAINLCQFKLLKKFLSEIGRLVVLFSKFGANSAPICLSLILENVGQSEEYDCDVGGLAAHIEDKVARKKGSMKIVHV